MIERQTNRHLKIFSLHQRFVLFLFVLFLQLHKISFIFKIQTIPVSSREWAQWWSFIALASHFASSVSSIGRWHNKIRDNNLWKRIFTWSETVGSNKDRQSTAFVRAETARTHRSSTSPPSYSLCYWYHCQGIMFASELLEEVFERSIHNNKMRADWTILSDIPSFSLQKIKMILSLQNIDRSYSWRFFKKITTFWVIFSRFVIVMTIITTHEAMSALLSFVCCLSLVSVHIAGICRNRQRQYPSPRFVVDSWSLVDDFETFQKISWHNKNAKTQTKKVTSNHYPAS